MLPGEKSLAFSVFCIVSTHPRVGCPPRSESYLRYTLPTCNRHPKSKYYLSNEQKLRLVSDFEKLANGEMGMPVSRNMVILKASSLDTKYAIVVCFLYANNLVICSKMHQTQKTRAVLEEIGHDFIASTIPRLVEIGCDQRFIINKDQMPVFFSMTMPKTMLQLQVFKTISMRASSDSTKHIRVAGYCYCKRQYGVAAPILDLQCKAEWSGRKRTRQLSHWHSLCHPTECLDG
jgi:hypothetical protein